ncbi:MAG: 6-hydroxymethylpterin diphosphokinase MptE-like protein [Halobacteriales archaeon]|nr:6-hydroxymethylpterin diphosphokinase MptE-like protein [Halobacteriales archaeon]
MDFETWEPVYEAILTDFGFDRTADERARDLLAEYVDPITEEILPAFAGAEVAIAGGGPTLKEEIAIAGEADIVVAASTAADVLRDANVTVDLMVTDLDKNTETARQFTQLGRPVAIHAHGDNIPALRAIMPQCDPAWVVATTQAEPLPAVANFGGFTDGDRGAFLADHFGAERLRFPGWSFDDPTVDAMKRRKLQWAKRLLYWLERRRGDRFAVLDDHREAITTDRDGRPLPPDR